MNFENTLLVENIKIFQIHRMQHQRRVKGFALSRRFGLRHQE